MNKILCCSFSKNSEKYFLERKTKDCLNFPHVMSVCKLKTNTEVIVKLSTSNSTSSITATLCASGSGGGERYKRPKSCHDNKFNLHLR